jgi:alcohol dehydrogenase class IV
LPFIAVPTTAGTGAEATRNAVIASEEHRVKASLRHLSMLPRIALIDPELAVDLPPHVTAASGMDALTQCLEAFVCSRAQPMTDALCLDGINAPRAHSNVPFKTVTTSTPARTWPLCALNSGIALANAGLGAVHGFAAPIGGMFHAPHGAVCAALLAPVWETNSKRVANRAKFDQVERFARRRCHFLAARITQRLHIPQTQRLGHWARAISTRSPAKPPLPAA